MINQVLQQCVCAVLFVVCRHTTQTYQPPCFNPVMTAAPAAIGRIVQQQGHGCEAIQHCVAERCSTINYVPVHHLWCCVSVGQWGL